MSFPIYHVIRVISNKLKYVKNEASESKTER